MVAIFERRRFGIAMAAMIKMIATTINNSINEKPSFLFLIAILLRRVNTDQIFSQFAKALP